MGETCKFLVCAFAAASIIIVIILVIMYFGNQVLSMTTCGSAKEGLDVVIPDRNIKYSNMKAYFTDKPSPKKKRAFMLRSVPDHAELE